MTNLINILNSTGDGFCRFALAMLIQSGILIVLLYLIDMLGSALMQTNDRRISLLCTHIGNIGQGSLRIEIKGRDPLPMPCQPDCQIERYRTLTGSAFEISNYCNHNVANSNCLFNFDLWSVSLPRWVITTIRCEWLPRHSG